MKSNKEVGSVFIYIKDGRKSNLPIFFIISTQRTLIIRAWYENLQTASQCCTFASQSGKQLQR